MTTPNPRHAVAHDDARPSNPFALLLGALVVALTGCGGGGGGGGSAEATAPPTAATLSTTEFTGVWKREAASDACIANFPYNTAYRYKLRDITLSAAGAQVEAKIAMTAFSDAACTVKQGIVVETLSFAPSLGSAPSRDNVLQAEPSFTGSLISADGGMGMTLNKMPDGSASGWRAVKLIADVQDGRLYVTTSSMGGVPNPQGFPSAIDPANRYVR